MTKKHFERAAEICRLEQHLVHREILANGFIELFQDFNPRFDASRFRKACGL